MTNIIIKCENKYNFEGTDSSRTWDIEVTDKQNLLDSSITDQLKQFDKPIYFNDTSGNYWLFDFKIENVWFESREIDCNNMKMVLNAYN